MSDLPSPFHIPVLVEEVCEVFSHAPKGAVVDLTTGGGGHSYELLNREIAFKVLSCDRDLQAVHFAKERLAQFGSRSLVLQAKFSQLSDIFQYEDVLSFLSGGEVLLAGALADLGVSSHHFDDEERGFSFRSHAALDMRMDQSSGDLTAAEVINTYSEAELVRIFRDNGEARLARRYARAIIGARPVNFGDELGDLIESATPHALRRGRIHPATRIFQAIRLEVNQEIDELSSLLEQLPEVLGSNGIAGIMSYHSGEDRLVKRAFRSASNGDCICPPALPCVCGARPWAREVTRKPITATAEEKDRNPRSRSAKFRAIQKLSDISIERGWEHG